VLVTRTFTYTTLCKGACGASELLSISGDGFLMHCLLMFLPVRDIIRLGRASACTHTISAGLGQTLLRARHPLLELGRWPSCWWWFAASSREEASFLEDFGNDWRTRWKHSCSLCYVKACSTALAIGPPLGHTVYPGSGAICVLPEPLHPRTVSWLTCAKGVYRAGEGRAGCFILQERKGLEMMRVYFSHGSLWWEASDHSPVPLLPCGVLEDAKWYRVHCQMDWESRSADVTVQALDSGSDEVYGRQALPWHSRGCESVKELAVGSCVFGASPLSGAEVSLAEVCLV